ncbi:hypothetical protein [Streptomyces poriferorum]|uniref:LPXTG cell wall anchor domain-containing protein n=1 Tax=Streptomyces poriferorum TaxID=2798799 RepID=A0ABY9J2W4_9ACTN|nr:MULTISPECIES: hypothetical protein [unclassified Streptomyces]MDP5311806.1 hypothetical protein [Streptomyces sp. Alt4]WLQ61982.1 hypothetical protein P8A19_28480 [Streptomyces sp. Alt2]
MRSPARLVTGTAAAALAAAALGLSAAAPSAYGDELGPLEISPASAAPGSTVTVNTTACGSDTGATGDASALDASEFALAPATLKEVLAGSFQVPGAIEPGPYSIDVACENGKRATGEIEVKAAGTTGKESAAVPLDEDSPAGAGLPSDEDSPAGAGLLSDESSPAGAGLASDLYDSEEYDTTGLDEAEASGSALVPDTPALPGRGTPTARPTTRPTPRPTPSGHQPPSGRPTSAAPTSPTGHVKTGVGGSVGPDTTQIAAGAGVLAATAVGGAWLLRRRASGTQDGS